jgi:tetratricopeptide (TPR) repeat protein
VGFTRRAEELDPEEVRALLRPYHGRVRSELERHGGTVEKFIGDAVMALFGAPLAHEDDPERAVRAALAIRDFALEEDLELRVGITTGEALISLDVNPAEGEGMASGDVVNTAARLQSAAPVNGVLADETTYRATRRAIDFESTEPVEAKGKAERISVWVASSAHSRFGIDVTHHARTELVGREREVAALREAFERARQEQAPQLVTLVGVPGIGKSRLVYELQQIADADPELVAWRQGRCLAYGDGVAFWALAEVVKAQAGIDEQDTDEEAAKKLHAAVADALAEEADVRWVESHLRPLVGLETETGLGGDRRGEAFAAWRRFLEALAEKRPLVLVLEDLHWADEGLLDFVEELIDWLHGVPLLVVCSARPELLERRPGWVGGKLNASTLGLSPLSNDETAVFIAQVLERVLLPAEIQQALLERAEGNPLYAEQFAELYRERGSAEDLPLPETLQGVVAARLDGLSTEEKALLQDASVLGKVFWVGALRRGEGETTGVLHSLARKGFLTHQRRSSIEGEGEWAFAHMLLRDVAYGQIPRAERAEKHRKTAEWIASLGRSEDHAELLAFHWRSALELAAASGEDTADLSDRTRVALAEAGDRAFGLNAFGSAVAYYAEALALWPPDAPGRAELLFRRAHALHVMGDEKQEAALGEARDASLEIGDEETAGQAEAFLSRAAWYRGRGEEARQHIERAQELVANAGPTMAKARVLCLLARLLMLSSQEEAAIRTSEEALALAEALDLDELRIHALTTLGSAKLWLDHSGEVELERALGLAKAVNSPLATSVLNNLAVLATKRGDVARAEELNRETLQLAQQFGDRDITRFARGNLLFSATFRGRWDEMLHEADRFIAECEVSPHNMETAARSMRAYVRLARGDIKGALDDWGRDLEVAREMGDPTRVLPALLNRAQGLCLLGRLDEARAHASEAIEMAKTTPTIAELLFLIAGEARQLGIATEVVELITTAPDSPWKDAAIAQATGDPLRAVEIYARMGAPSIEADARFNAAVWLLEEGRTAEGFSQLEKALAFYRSVGAAFFIERGQRLLAKSA